MPQKVLRTEIWGNIIFFFRRPTFEPGCIRTNLIGLEPKIDSETIQTHTRCGIENSKCDRKNNIFSFDRAYNGQTESNTVVHLDRDPVDNDDKHLSAYTHHGEYDNDPRSAEL